MVSQSDLLPMMIATSALEDFDSGMAAVHQFPITGRVVTGFFCQMAPTAGLLEDFRKLGRLGYFSGMTGRSQSIVLIGFMGAGKSSTGKALARKTGLPRFDTDEIVSARFGLYLSDEAV